jgi:hypothetical protein
MATEQTTKLTKRAQVWEHHIHCLLGSGTSRTYCWLPERVKIGDELTMYGLRWSVLEIFGKQKMSCSEKSESCF